MNPGTFLPQELIDKFIDDLWFERDIDALKTLSQTSHLFLHRCRRHLFGYISLSSGNSTGQSQRIARKAKNLDEVFAKVPEVANYVESLNFMISNFSDAEVHIISQLFLQFSMIDELSLYMYSPCDWALVAPELQSAISRLVYSPRMDALILHGIHNFPVSFFAPCTNLTYLGIHSCALEDDAPLGNAETALIARLQILSLGETSVGLEKLICGTRGQDGPPILDFSHLQELTADLPEQEALPPLREILRRATQLTSLSMKVDEECSLNDVFQPSISFENLKILSLRFSIDEIDPKDPLFGLCHELRRIERSNGLEEILIKVSTTLKLQPDFLADLNDVLTLPGYTKLRCLRLEILLWLDTVEEYDREESRRELNNAAQARCSQLLHRPSLDFSYLVAVQGIDDDVEDIVGYYYCER
ncbi:uncharacterized protein LACBIDRAFT_331838 [Laccaria bicolor S238N-H82]|uniref:Predicted protein n=1 Tax=Laccaria bicolor (strain S238N-H82 / ATCC MYA-4686) TaxID=486041 RepID=B0DQQ6_LACBS|nr:uncharacterized protein LACBIDRAFT_331838 [Laccaria bicolor S238N-H82]EDR03157.1 predicted protein [Laccaria bicolor S238N-H82]|eukprot:XP_001886298.1 predicted protein [Laccaria bicolor S238N-H82]